MKALISRVAKGRYCSVTLPLSRRLQKIEPSAMPTENRAKIEEARVSVPSRVSLLNFGICVTNTTPNTQNQDTPMMAWKTGWRVAAARTTFQVSPSMFQFNFMSGSAGGAAGI